MTTSHRSGMLGLACVLVIAACTSTGGGSSTSVPATADGSLIAEAMILQSADGVLELELPAGSVREGDDVGIDIVDPADVAGLEDVTPIGKAYRLRPEGLIFVEPLIATYRIPVEEAGRFDDLPLIIAMIESGGAVGAEIEGLTEISETGEFIHLSTIDRFGTFVLIDGGVAFTLAPELVTDLAPDESFVATLTATVVSTAIGPGSNYDMEMRWSATGAVSEESAGAIESVTGFGADPSEPEWKVFEEYTCDVVGSGLHRVEIGIDVGGLPGDAETREFVTLEGEASCGDVGR